ncbi:MAG TPA: hypothetical protein VF199_13930 [Bacillales bacterium]
MHLKRILWVVLPFAALIGTWIGFEAGGVSYSGGRSGLLILFAFWAILGVCVYVSTERVKMNRKREYR